tara:strand:+ start:922 stop:1197 length:276 start_codon:yes stop_codon:yes gene_type:complete
MVCVIYKIDKAVSWGEAHSTPHKDIIKITEGFFNLRRLYITQQSVIELCSNPCMLGRGISEMPRSKWKNIFGVDSVSLSEKGYDYLEVYND